MSGCATESVGAGRGLAGIGVAGTRAGRRGGVFNAGGTSRAPSGPQRAPSPTLSPAPFAFAMGGNFQDFKDLRTGSQNSWLRPYASLLMRAVILSKCTGSCRPSRFTTYMAILFWSLLLLEDGAGVYGSLLFRRKFI